MNNFDPISRELSKHLDKIVENMSDEDIDNFVQEQMDRRIKEVYFEDSFGMI